MNLDLSLNRLRGIRDSIAFHDPAYVIELSAQIEHIESLQKQLDTCTLLKNSFKADNGHHFQMWNEAFTELKEANKKITNLISENQDNFRRWSQAEEELVKSRASMMVMENRMKALEAALLEYTETDETGIGQPGNEYYEGILFRAQDLLGVPRTKATDRDGD